MNTQAILLLSHLLALTIFAAFTRYYEVPLNARLIQADGAADTLKKGWHQRRTWVRFWWGLACLLLGSAPLPWLEAKSLLPVAALGILLATFFLRTFGPLLNHHLRLAYKSRFYASPASASFPDAQVWQRVRRAFPGESDAALQARANRLNQRFLNAVLVGGLVGYAGLMAGWLLGWINCG